MVLEEPPADTFVQWTARAAHAQIEPTPNNLAYLKEPES